jgi:putative oxidoreductase
MTAPSVVATWPSRTPYLLSILRIVAAFTFMQFGTAKLFAFPAAIMPGGGTAPLASLVGVAAALESFGGLLILLGLFTRPVAFLLSGEMAIAYFYGHAPQGFWTVLNQGTPAVLYCFIWLYFSAAGAGPLSLDALRAKAPSGHRSQSPELRRSDALR